MRLYQLFDKVADTVEGPVLTFGVDAPAVRMFHDLLMDERTGPGRHPGDYELLCVGSQDSTGVIAPCGRIVVATGASFVEGKMREAAAQTKLQLEA